MEEGSAVVECEVWTGDAMNGPVERSDAAGAFLGDVAGDLVCVDGMGAGLVKVRMTGYRPRQFQISRAPAKHDRFDEWGVDGLE